MILRQIARAALVVGTLDIVEVTIFYWLRGVKPISVVQGVAVGLLGRDAFKGGIPTALLGLAIHFFIATVVVCVYHFASRKIAVLRHKPIVMGVLYGLAVWAFMNFVVVPLSAAGPPKFRPPMVANGLFAHVFCVGIPAALLARARQAP